jgi:hypothetical protein
LAVRDGRKERFFTLYQLETASPFQRQYSTDPDESDTPDNPFTAINMAIIDKDRWVAYLDEEIAFNDEDTLDHYLATIIKDLLLVNNYTAVADVARQIDAYYSGEFLRSDPLLKFQDDKGMEIFLSILYRLVFDLAELISYKDSRQDTLVELILELRKLPPKQLKIWKVCCVFIASSLATLTLWLGGVFGVHP